MTEFHVARQPACSSMLPSAYNGGAQLKIVNIDWSISGFRSGLVIFSFVCRIPA
jgi:hypothetical protein